MLQARHTLPLPPVSKNTGWGYSWSFDTGSESAPAEFPMGTTLALGLRRQGVPETAIDCDAYVLRDGPVVTVAVPRAVTASTVWPAGTYDGQLRIIDPELEVDLWEVLFTIAVTEGIDE